jgi:hypothetical protein
MAVAHDFLKSRSLAPHGGVPIFEDQVVIAGECRQKLVDPGESNAARKAGIVDLKRHPCPCVNIAQKVKIQHLVIVCGQSDKQRKPMYLGLGGVEFPSKRAVLGPA